MLPPLAILPIELPIFPTLLPISLTALPALFITFPAPFVASGTKEPTLLLISANGFASSKLALVKLKNIAFLIFINLRFLAFVYKFYKFL